MLISADFEGALSAFMKNNWDGTRKESEVFAEYCAQMKNFIQNVSFLLFRVSEEKSVISVGLVLIHCLKIVKKS